MSQLADLARPFAQHLIKSAPSGKYGSYVSHDAVNQKLLAVLGPFSFEVKEWLTGVDGTIEGCLASMTVEVDGHVVVMTEVGDCEQPTNWKTQGARAKDAASDAFKRCAMRLGCGLHLWAGNDPFFLYDVLSKREEQPRLMDVEPNGEML